MEPKRLSQSDRRELLRLIDLCLDSDLDVAGQERLSAILNDSEEARILYSRYVGLTASLYAHAADTQGDSLVATKVNTEKKKGLDRIALVGAIAALFIASGIAVLRQYAEPELSSGAALVTAVEAEWERVDQRDRRSSLVILPGESVPNGVVQLSSGWATVEFETGSQLVVEAPARFQILGNNSTRVLEGKFAATVPPSGHGFTIDLPRGQVVDLGTRFGVSVDEGADATEVHVLDGLTEFSEGDRVVSLPGGRALAIPDDPAVEVVEMEASSDLFVFHIDSRKPQILSAVPLPYDDSFDIPSGTGGINQNPERLRHEVYSSENGVAPYRVNDGTLASIIGGELVLSSEGDPVFGVTLAAPVEQLLGSRHRLAFTVKASHLGQGSMLSGVALSKDGVIASLTAPSHELAVALERASNELTVIVWNDGEEVGRRRLSGLEKQVGVDDIAIAIEMVPNQASGGGYNILVDGELTFANVTLSDLDDGGSLYVSLIGNGEGFHIFDDLEIVRLP